MLARHVNIYMSMLIRWNGWLRAFRVRSSILCFLNMGYILQFENIETFLEALYIFKIWCRWKSFFYFRNHLHHLRIIYRKSHIKLPQVFHTFVAQIRNSNSASKGVKILCAFHAPINPTNHSRILYHPCPETDPYLSMIHPWNTISFPCVEFGSQLPIYAEMVWVWSCSIIIGASFYSIACIFQL